MGKQEVGASGFMDRSAGFGKGSKERASGLGPALSGWQVPHRLSGDVEN